MPRTLLDLHYGRSFQHAAAQPLTSLLLNLELSAQHTELNKSPYVRHAWNCAQRLQELFSLCSSNNSSFKINQAFRDIVNLSVASQQAVVWQSSLPTDLTLLGNRFYFQEAVSCAIHNGLESYSHGAQPLIKVIMRLEDGMLMISFSDGGCGMGWLVRKLIFIDGLSLKKDHKGVGMTWIKQVVVDHFKGQIQIVSKKGKGTTMIWRIPYLSE